MRALIDFPAGAITVDGVCLPVEMNAPAGVARIAWDDAENGGVVISGDVSEGGHHSAERFSARDVIAPYLTAYEAAFVRHQTSQREAAEQTALADRIAALVPEMRLSSMTPLIVPIFDPNKAG